MTENTTPAHPLVDFSGSSRETAREYAAALNSRVLNPDNQAILKQASSGGQVDVYRLNAAVTEGLSACATRLGQSMARRDLTRKGRYLGHIAQAVLEAHGDGLPVYADTGVRSRKVEELTREIEHAGSVNQALARDLTTAREERTLLTQAASDERRRLCKEIDDNHAQAIAEGAALQAKIVEAEKDRDIYAAAVAYVLESLDEANRARVLGYIDGVKDGLK